MYEDILTEYWLSVSPYCCHNWLTPTLATVKYTSEFKLWILGIILGKLSNWREITKIFLKCLVCLPHTQYCVIFYHSDNDNFDSNAEIFEDCEVHMNYRINDL